MIGVTVATSPHLLALTPVVRIVSVIVAAIGCIDLVGWTLGIQAVVLVIPGLPVMSPNTGALFIFAGVSLWILATDASSRVKRAIGYLCAGVVMLIGLLTFGEYVVGINLGIDGLLVPQPPRAFMIGIPVRMSPQSTLNFILVGGTLLLLNVRRPSLYLLPQALALLAAVNALIALTGYAYRVAAFYSIAAPQIAYGMSLYSAITFLVLCAGLLCVHPDRALMAMVTSEYLGGTMVRRLLPAETTILLVLGLLITSGARAGSYSTSFGFALLTVSSLVALVIATALIAHTLNEADSARQQVLVREERLRVTVETERARLQAILESATNAIIYLDVKTEHILANPEAARLFGHEMIPVAGRAQYAGQIHDPDGRPVQVQHLPSSRALHGERPPRTELLIVRPDGSRVPVLVNAAPVQLPDGTVLGVVVVFQDISVLKELERLREEWTSIITHDLRQPVTIIAGYADLLARQAWQLPPALQAPVDHIRASARQLERMIRDLLDVSRIEARRLTLQRERVDLPGLVRDVVGRTEEITRGHPIRVDVKDEIPALLADPGRVEQILGNLLSNAAKFAYPETAITVDMTRQDEVVEVAVTNWGEGMTSEHLNRLFTRFYRAPEAQGGRVAGVGLGLYISKGLVEAHGGQIWAKSTPGQTTMVAFTLPIPTASSTH
jgi:PAS domain S-box-containing protein